MLNIKKFTVNPFQENCLLIWDETSHGVIVDPGCMRDEETEELLHYAEASGVVVKKILLTHGHFDHIYGVKAVAAALGATVYMNAADAELVATGNQLLTQYYRMPDAPTDFEFTPVKEGDEIAFGNTKFSVIETPGHTFGGVCYYCKEEKLLVSGDTLFAGAIGRTDSQWGDYDKLIVAIMEKLMGLDGDVEVIPGHGPVTNIGYERTHNPFLQPFNEPDGDIDNEDELYIQGE